MGLVAKSLTKRKVAPESAPDNLVADSPLEKSLLGAARVRDAMLSRKIDGVSSQTGRGKVSTFASGKGSMFWYRYQSDTSWSLTLGTLTGANRQAADWTLQADAPGDGQVTVSTPEYLTTDGALANPRVYDQVRSGLLDAFAFSSLPGEAEIDLCRLSLATETARVVRPAGKVSGPVRLRVAASVDDVDHALAQIGLPMTRPTATEFQWRLGLGDNHLKLTRSGTDGAVVLEGSLELAVTIQNYPIACAEAAAAAWRGRAAVFLEDIDPAYELSWPESS